MSNAPSLRERLTAAAADLKPETPVRLLAKRRAPLTRDGKALGQLEALLRVTFRRGEPPAQGILVFDWPHAAGKHSATAPLEAWSNRCEDGAGAVGAVRLERRTVELGNGTPAGEGTHLKVMFPLAEIPDDLAELLTLATRLGLDEAIRAPLDRAVQDQVAAVAAASQAAEAAVTAERGVTAEPAIEAPAVDEPEPEPEVDLDVERVTEPATPSQPAAAEPTAPVLSPEVQAQVDAISHNDVYDASRHPQVGINEEVINSNGETFRLVQKRRGSGRKRVWTRVAQSLAIAGRR